MSTTPPPTPTAPPRYVTMGLTFGAYANRENPGKGRVMRTHSVRVTDDAWTPLCRVQSDSLALNVTEAEDAAPPTCATCRRRDPRFKEPTDD